LSSVSLVDLKKLKPRGHWRRRYRFPWRKLAAVPLFLSLSASVKGV
jgi:hypothetical protein